MKIDSLNTNPNTNIVKPAYIDDNLDDSIRFGIKNLKEIPSRLPLLNQTQTTENKDLQIPQLKNNYVNGWQTLILLTLVIIVILSKAFNQNRTRLLTKSLFNYNTATEIIREEKVFFHRLNIWFSIVHIVIVALLIYQLKIYFNLSYSLNSRFSVFLLFIGYVFSFYFLKYLIANILFFIFNRSELALEYSFSVSIYNNLLGIILLPLMMIMYYTTIDIYTATKYIVIPVLFIVFLMRLIRFIIAGNSHNVSYLYIFLYICTLEILPLVVMYKVFILN